MKIAILLPTIISKHGTAKQSVELAKVLSDRGHSVEFFTFAYNKSGTFPDFGSFRVSSCVRLEDSFIYKFIKNISLLEKVYLYIAFFQISRFRGLLEGKTFDILNPHDWFTLWVAGGKKDRSEIGPRVVAHINDVPDRVNGRALDKLKLIMDRKHTKAIDHVIVMDNKNKTRVIEWLKLTTDKVTVVRSGLDAARYKDFKMHINIRRLLKIDTESFIVVCANLLAPNRRYEDVILALSKLGDISPSIHLVILSKLDFNPKYAHYLREVIAANHLESRVHFIDKFFSDEERMMYIKGSDLLVFPNSPQTWGLTVIEAMALGVPVIASTGAGVSEVLTDNVNAIIYKERNVEELADKLVACLRNKTKLIKLAKNARNFVLSSFSWEKYGVQIEKIMRNNL